MKKRFASLLLCSSLLALTSCGGDAGNNNLPSDNLLEINENDNELVKTIKNIHNTHKYLVSNVIYSEQIENGSLTLRSIFTDEYSYSENMLSGYAIKDGTLFSFDDISDNLDGSQMLSGEAINSETTSLFASDYVYSINDMRVDDFNRLKQNELGDYVVRGTLNTVKSDILSLLETPIELLSYIEEIRLNVTNENTFNITIEYKANDFGFQFFQSTITSLEAEIDYVTSFVNSELCKPFVVEGDLKTLRELFASNNFEGKAGRFTITEDGALGEIKDQLHMNFTPTYFFQEMMDVYQPTTSYVKIEDSHAVNDVNQKFDGVYGFSHAVSPTTGEYNYILHYMTPNEEFGKGKYKNALSEFDMPDFIKYMSNSVLMDNLQYVGIDAEDPSAYYITQTEVVNDLCQVLQVGGIEGNPDFGVLGFKLELDLDNTDISNSTVTFTAIGYLGGVAYPHERYTFYNFGKGNRPDFEDFLSKALVKNA